MCCGEGIKSCWRADKMSNVHQCFLALVKTEMAAWVAESKAGNIDLQMIYFHLPRRSLEHVVGQNA